MLQGFEGRAVVAGLFEKRLPGFVCHAIPGAVDHGQPVVPGKPGAMPVKKIPIKAVERTGVLPRALCGVVPASAAIVTHFAYIIGRGDIRFGGHDAAVGKLAHPACVDNLYPLDGIDINPQIPFIHRIGMDAGSTVVGYLLAVLTILTTFVDPSAGAPIGALAPLVVTVFTGCGRSPSLPEIPPPLAEPHCQLSQGPTAEEASLGQNLLYGFFAPVGAAVKATQIGQAMIEVTMRDGAFDNGDRLGTRSIIRYSDAYEQRAGVKP